MSPSSHGPNGLQTRQESPPPPPPQQQQTQTQQLQLQLLPQPQTQTQQTQQQAAQQTAQQTAQQSMTSMLERHDAHLKMIQMIAEQLETVIDWVHRRQV
jgi:hypothetical protein